MTVRPEKRSALLETLMGMLEPTRVERGCLSYHLYENAENRNSFVLLEEWATQEDLERHISRNNQRSLLALMDLLSEKPDFDFAAQSHIAGIELIKKVLQMDLVR
jgi:quinol monooxygenase YgiN